MDAGSLGEDIKYPVRKLNISNHNFRVIPDRDVASSVYLDRIKKNNGKVIKANMIIQGWNNALIAIETKDAMCQLLMNSDKDNSRNTVPRNCRSAF